MDIIISIKPEAFEAVEAYRKANGTWENDPNSTAGKILKPYYASFEEFVDVILTQTFKPILERAGVGGDEAAQIEAQIAELQGQLAEARKPTNSVMVKK